MSEKYVWTCYRCGVQSTAYGVGNVPNGWTAQSLCPRCAAKKADEKEKRIQNTPYESGGCLDIFTFLSGIAGFIFFAFPYYNTSSFERIVGVVFLVFCFVSLRFTLKREKKKGIAFILYLLIIDFGIYYFVFDGNLFSIDDRDKTKDEQVLSSSEILQKKSSYLQGVDDIEDVDELRKFYYKIASDFYNNEMGLKGSPEQIDAGNKVMSDVYGFLGLSLSKGEIQNVDSIKAVIQNNAVISDYRKKKAVEELEFGIETIESFQ